MEIPLQLWDQPHWELRGEWDSVLFFRHLLEVVPGATTLFIEGTSIAADVDEFLRSAVEPGDYLPKSQTIWPRPKRYRVPCNHSTVGALSGLAERHAEPELMDHLFVYGGEGVLVEAPDVFFPDCPMHFSGDVEEQRIRRFAAALGLEVTCWDPNHGAPERE